MHAKRLKLSLLAALLVFVCACTATAFAAAPSPTRAGRAVAAATKAAPTLGVKPANNYESGFGTVKPKVVSFGGDGQSLVTQVKWSSWGGAHAVGHGRASWVWPGWCSACGSVILKATVVAYDLTRCDGHSVYAYVEWFFPGRGESFSKLIGEGNLCHKQLSVPGVDRIKQRSCGTGTLASGGATIGEAEKIEAYGVRCGAAKSFIKSSGALSHYGHNARFHRHGWWCGSELSMELTSKPWQDFSCVKGDTEQLYFSVKPAASA